MAYSSSAFDPLADGLSRYTTLLTPKQIVIKSNMVGYELDLRSSDFQSLMVTNAARVTAGMGVVGNKELFPDVF